MPFWDPRCFDLNDKINAEIWADSPQLQQGIHPPLALEAAGAFGAQQAMIELADRVFWDNLQPPSILPWVPDLVGKRWKKKDAVFVVGSAYAGFIKEYSTRTAAMNLCCYATANSATQFQERFLQDVVQPDSDYYGKLELLVQPYLYASQLCLMDLCRASFVKRGNRVTRRPMDTSKEPNRGPAWNNYLAYAQHVQSDDWTWRRLTESKTEKIVALGSIAEHGILQLFGRNLNPGFTIIDRDGAPLDLPDFWNRTYAHPGRNLGYWLNEDDWWIVQGQVGGEKRRWRVLPIYHPSRVESYDPLYARTRGLFAEYLNA